MKRRKRIEVKRSPRGQGLYERSCAWCANPVPDDYVTVTFPDKDQAIFHLECLYRYRVAMWPEASRHTRGPS